MDSNPINLSPSPPQAGPSLLLKTANSTDFLVKTQQARLVSLIVWIDSKRNFSGLGVH